jgi:hypothetical protein
LGDQSDTDLVWTVDDEFYKKSHKELFSAGGPKITWGRQTILDCLNKGF